MLLKLIIAGVLCLVLEIVVLGLFMTPPGWCVLILLTLAGVNPLDVHADCTEGLWRWARE